MTKKSSRILITVLLISILISGCANNKGRHTDIDINEYTAELTELLKTGNTDSDIYSSEFEFSRIIAGEDISIKHSYTTNNAIYLQINNKYMYRFTLNENNKIDSYIKYYLEA